MKNLIVLLLAIVPIFAMSQSKKELRSNKIQSKTIERTEQKDGQTITYKESYEVYDKNGNTILREEYNKAGEVKTKESFKYDNFGNMIEKIEFEKKTGKTIKTLCKYNADGNKIEETVYDSGGNIIEKKSYSYNNKALRTEVKEYNGKGELRWKKSINYKSF